MNRNQKKLEFGKWQVECFPADGARLSRLSYNGFDLLTKEPTSFCPPKKDYGQYETRPVYGYDDCFPTVDACRFPVGNNFDIPDHGELCWLGWDLYAQPDQLICQIHSKLLPVTFTRTMTFEETSLKWEFAIVNESEKAIPFLHVMHALMPIQNIKQIKLPNFKKLYDEMREKLVEFNCSESLVNYLLCLDKGKAEMLLLNGIETDQVEITLNNGRILIVEFSKDLFPTLGIWWNNAGYPDEDGCRRIECAIEPMPATTSSLEASYADGVYLSVPPDGRLEWEVNWNINT